LDYIGSFLLALSDNIDLESRIYEDYDFHYTDMTNFMLDILVDSGYITEDIKIKSQKIRKLSDKMFADEVERSADFIRNSKDWNEIFSLADEIRQFLNK